MEFGVLGPIEVRHGGRPVALPPQRRLLLALLLCRVNTVVPADLLVDGLWGSTPPRTAAKSLQIQVHHLRRALGGESRIGHRDPGYVLLAEPDEVDALRFESLAGQGRAAIAAGDAREGARTLRRALALWRGPAFAGSDHVSVVGEEALRLDELRWGVEEDLIGAELDLGRHADVAPRAAALVARHPFRERLRGQLMVALYRLGRQAEALDVHREGRRLLAEQLGVEPGAWMRELEHAILVHDPALDAPGQRPPGRGAPTGRPSRPPDQLPADVTDFTGRGREVASMVRFLTGDSGPVRRTALALTTLCGRPGVGKTALAVHVAHRLREVFPDGRLYVNLRGVEAEPADPSQVLTRFLQALGVGRRAVPGHPDERVDLYRDLTAGRRVLVVLDNARDERQVRPLLPGSAGCGVIVTSRARLSGLEGAQVVTLDGFGSGAALELLSAVAGPERVAAEPAAAERVVRLCGHLPLAVRIAAARLAARPDWHLARFAERLSDEHRLLDELAVGDLEVRGSIALSYQVLDGGRRRLFRLLGHLPGPDFPGWVAAPLADVSPEAAERLVESLVEARLLEAVPGERAEPTRYRLHDLLRAYARERSAVEDPPADVRAALGRLYGAWLFLAERADDRLGFAQHLVRIVRSGAARWVPDPATAGAVACEPLAWMERERPALIAVVLHAAELGMDDLAWDLAGCLTRFLQGRWYPDDLSVTLETALRAVRRSGDRRGEASVLRAIAEMDMDHDRYDEALGHLRTAADIFAACGDERGWAHVRRASGSAYRMLGRLDDAFACLRESLPIVEREADEPGLACVLATLGSVHVRSGRHEEALRAYERARELFRRLGDVHHEAYVLCGLGSALHVAGRTSEAEDRFHESLAICGEHRVWSGEMFARASLGALYIETGELRSADRELTAALAISEEFGDRFGTALCLRDLGLLRRRQGRTREAEDHIRRAYALYPPLEPPLTVRAATG